MLHNLSVAIGFPAFAVACAMFWRRFHKAGQRGWAIYTGVTVVAFSVAAELAFRGFGHTTGLGPTAGLFERVTGTIAFTWITALAIHLLRKPRGTRG